MKTDQKDKSYSVILLLMSCFFIVYALGTADLKMPIPGGSIIDYVLFMVDTYLDIILISYVFICLQFAGYYELKYKQDYITISLLAISLTPISLLFIKKNKNK